MLSQFIGNECVIKSQSARRWGRLLPEASGTDGDDEVSFVQLSAEPWHLTLSAHLKVLPQVQHNLNRSEPNLLKNVQFHWTKFFLSVSASPHSSRSLAGSRQSSGWRCCVSGSLCWSSRWRPWGVATAVLGSKLHFDWTTHYFLHPAGCRCFLMEKRVQFQHRARVPNETMTSSAIRVFTLLLLATHDSEESGKGWYNDQRDGNGHGTDGSRPGGLDWNKHTRLKKRI